MNAPNRQQKKYAYLIEVVDDRAESPIEAANRFTALTKLCIPVNGYLVIRAEPMKAPASLEKTRQQIDAEFDRLTDPRSNT